MKRGLIYIILFISITGFSQKARSFQFDIGLTQTHNDFFYLYNGVLKMGGAYHFGLTKNLFGRFNFIYLNKDSDFTQLNYYRNVYLTSFGVGVNIKSYVRKK